MTFRHPFQKLCIVPGSQQRHQLLLAASGPTLSCIAVDVGKLLHQWPRQPDDDSGDESAENNGDRPSKRRKTGQSEHGSLSKQHSEASDASIEIVAERKKGERKKSKIIDHKLPTVSHILATSDGNYAVAVTSEDKAIRVFEISPSGKLKQLSQRSLPKKLCALRLTKDEATILTADKFGDVYALPLHPVKDWAPKQKPENGSSFKPSASELTVHTKGNLQALRQQQKVKKANPAKEGPQFEYKVLLGHVSLLTDILSAEGMVDGRPRPYIITADRDEHIRVSRGIPQAHIIENFCLGQKEFVTRLCIPPAASDLLISGGGDGTLSIHYWQTGKLHKTIMMWTDTHDLSYDENGHYDPESRELPEGRSSERLAVSGIWPIEFSRTVNPKGEEQSIFFIAVEGLPLLIPYILTPRGLSSGLESIKLRGNVLDLVCLNDKNQILVSLDGVHRPCSMKSYRSQPEQKQCHLQAFELSFNEKRIGPNEKFIWTEVDLPVGIMDVIETLPEAPTNPQDDEVENKGYEKIFSPLGEILYGLENLRKKRGAAAAEAEAEAAEEAEEPELLEQPTET